MSASTVKFPTNYCSLALLAISLALTCSAALAQDSKPKSAEETLVRVNITTEVAGSPESASDFGGRIIPKGLRIVEAFPGIVADDKGHVLTFLGYSGGSLRARNPRIDVTDPRGKNFPAKLVGIDQSMKIAVVLCHQCGLTKTPICETCEINKETTVIVPVLEGPVMSQFESAQLIAASTKGNASGGGGWTVKLSRPLSLVGSPLVDNHKVVGVVAHQDTQDLPPAVTILTIFQMLGSADRIIATRGDIQSGWLGVSPESYPDSGAGVTIAIVEPESPAAKAGIMPGDVIVKWNGATIQDQRRLIQMIQDTPVNSKALIEVLRQGKPVTVAAVIGARKQQDPGDRMVIDLQDLMSMPGARIIAREVQLPSGFGIDTVPLTPQLAGYFQLPVQSGLLVSSVTRQAAFDLAGVLAGDIILGVDGLRVGDPQTFYEHIKTRGWGSQLILRILRKGKELSKTIQLPSRKRD